MIRPPCSPSPTDSIWWALPFGPLEWELTPPAVQEYIPTQRQPLVQYQSQLVQFQAQIEQLQQQGEALQGRVDHTSHTSRKPPSSDSPLHKPKRQRKTSPGKRGGPQGHRGTGPPWLRPTEVHLIAPGLCPCGHGPRVSLTPSYTPQVLELPPIAMAVHHVIVPQGHGSGGGRQLKAQVPGDAQAGYGPRFRALIAALAGRHRTSWRLIQDCCRSVCHIPISLGAVRKGIQRVSHASAPPYEAMAP